MVITPMASFLIAVAVSLSVLGMEVLHARRIRRVSHLAFGPGGRPAFWVAIASPLRVLAAGCATWALLVLLFLAPEVHEQPPERGASQHLLIALDVSPSMQLVDAGPGHEKQSRALWAGKLVEGVLDRLDATTTRVSLVAFYTDSKPILKETYDKEVVSNALDGLPMYAAFESGATQLVKGVNASLELARAWMPGSATLLVVSDGDALGSMVPDRLPASIADTIVLGVGDPHRTMEVGGHASRQDTTSLKTLAARLGGRYHQGNEKHIPTSMMEELTMIEPRLGGDRGLRDLAFMLGTFGTASLALITPMLALFGRPRSWNRARRMSVAGGAA